HTFNENVAEFHKGNIDHFHSLMLSGPRVVLFDRFERVPHGIGMKFEHFQSKGRFLCYDVYIFGVCIVFGDGEHLEVRSIKVHEKNGECTSAFVDRPYDGPSNGYTHRLFVIDTNGTTRLPNLRDIDFVTVEVDNEDIRRIARVLFINTDGEQLVEALT